MDKPEVREKAAREEAKKLVGELVYGDAEPIGESIDRILAYRQSCINEGLRMAAEGVDAEEELDGIPSEEMMESFKVDPVKTMRAAVRLTKSGIRTRIFALIPDKPKEQGNG